MRIIKTSLILSLTLLGSLSAQANDSILGFWLSESGEAVIEIVKEKGFYNGKIKWLLVEHSGKQKLALDIFNPEEKNKVRKIKGLKILSDFKFKGGEYSGGKVYDPNSGKTYKAFMKLQNKNKLKLRGYVGISLFGRTSYWRRQKTSMPDQFLK